MKTFSRDQRNVEVRVGERFMIELEAIPTTGYLWRVAAEESSVKLTDQSMDAPTGHAIGGSTVERFIFEPVQPGRAKVQFQLARPWETAPRETVEFEVRVVG